MYDDDPVLFAAGVSALGVSGGSGLAATGSTSLLLAAVIAAGVVVGVLVLRFAAHSYRRVRNGDH